MKVIVLTRNNFFSQFIADTRMGRKSVVSNKPKQLSALGVVEDSIDYNTTNLSDSLTVESDEYRYHGKVDEAGKTGTVVVRGTRQLKMSEEEHVPLHHLNNRNQFGLTTESPFSIGGSEEDLDDLEEEEDEEKTSEDADNNKKENKEESEEDDEEENEEDDEEENEEDDEEDDEEGKKEVSESVKTEELGVRFNNDIMGFMKLLHSQVQSDLLSVESTNKSNSMIDTVSLSEGGASSASSVSEVKGKFSDKNKKRYNKYRVTSEQRQKYENANSHGQQVPHQIHQNGIPSNSNSNVIPQGRQNELLSQLPDGYSGVLPDHLQEMLGQQAPQQGLSAIGRMFSQGDSQQMQTNPTQVNRLGGVLGMQQAPQGMNMMGNLGSAGQSAPSMSHLGSAGVDDMSMLGQDNVQGYQMQQAPHMKGFPPSVSMGQMGMEQAPHMNGFPPSVYTGQTGMEQGFDLTGHMMPPNGSYGEMPAPFGGLPDHMVSQLGLDKLGDSSRILEN